MIRSAIDTIGSCLSVYGNGINHRLRTRTTRVAWAGLVSRAPSIDVPVLQPSCLILDRLAGGQSINLIQNTNNTVVQCR
jgi:hypothetical protein